MLQPAQPHSFLRLLLLSLLALLLLATPASAGSTRIARSKARLNSRQSNGQTSFQTVETSNTPAGIVTQTCTVVLTPIVDGTGADMVEMSKTCTITVTPLNGSEPPPPSTSTSFIGGAPPSTDLPPAQPSATDAPPAEPSASDAPPADPGTSDAPPAESSATDGAPPVESSATTDAPPPAESTTDAGGSSTDSAAAPSETAAPSDAVPSESASATQSANGPGSAPAATPTETVAPTSVVDIGNDGTGTPTTAIAAEANAGPDLEAIGTTMMAASEASLIATAVGANAPASSTTAAAADFQLPGQQLQVLPIGLGVFAGVSVIALIVVGLVTYERTKYRKAFRERTLRMQNAGYGTTNAV